MLSSLVARVTTVPSWHPPGSPPPSGCPAAEQAELFAVPDVPSVHNSQCRTETDADWARMTMELMRVKASNEVVVWGKTGSRPGCTSGVSSTRDLSRKIVYALNPTTFNGTEIRYIPQIAAAAFGPIAPTDT